MENIAGSKSSLVWITQISVVLLVFLWVFPTLGLLVSSFRSADQIASSGWWSSMSAQERQNPAIRISGEEFQDGGLWVIEGNLFDNAQVEVSAWGTSSREPEAYHAEDVAELSNGRTVTVDTAGNFRMTAEESQAGARLPRVFTTATTPPEFTTENYQNMLFDPANVDGMAKAFIATLTVTIPATIIPILVAAFAAYALAWMEFPGRALLVAVVVALLVVPLQLALIPLLSFHGWAAEATVAFLGTADPDNARRFAEPNAFGRLLGFDAGDTIAAKGFIGVWMAHTGFGLPLAIYLLRNYMVGLPKDIIENARVDGATDFQIFTKIILPLSFPALAAFAIFQFLWTWNDLLVAKVFLLDATGETNVMTNQIVELLGTRGGNWEILATAAFVSIAVPLLVFFAMQRYLVRGLLAGSVK